MPRSFLLLDLTPQKVSSKPKRCECVFGRAAKVQCDFLRKRGARERANDLFSTGGKKQVRVKQTLLRRGASDGTWVLL